MKLIHIHFTREYCRPIPVKSRPHSIYADRSRIYYHRNPMREGEIPLKAWVNQEAQIKGLCPNAIWKRIYDGKYPHVEKAARRLNKRVVYVPADLQHSNL